MKTILTISLNEDGKTYNIQVSEGMSLSEVMFAVAVMIRCMTRDGVIEKHNIATDLLMKYLTDSQYDEVKS